MLIHEIFCSIQGEGSLMGRPSIFVRAAGCNLRCAWCDTPDASWDPEGENMGIYQVLEKISEWPQVKNIVLTGGEPLIFPEMAELCQLLKDQEYHVTIETSGHLYKNMPADLISLSPKLSSSDPEDSLRRKSHRQIRMQMDSIQQFIDHHRVQLKIVIANDKDLFEAQELISNLERISPQDIYLMPEGASVARLREIGQWLSRYCIEKGYCYSDRLHIRLWGNTSGT